MNDINKLTKPATLVYPTDVKRAEKEAPSILPEEKASVSVRMHGLVKLVHQGSIESAQDHSRVMAAKALIESGQYKVDTEKLAETLAKNPLLGGV